MKISLSKDRGQNQIQHASDREIVINETGYQSSIIVTPDHPVTPWQIESVEELKTSDFAMVEHINPEILILGCGNTHQMPDAKLLVQFYEQRIGFEVMTTLAACRTYNLLVEDERHVIAYLIMENSLDSI